MTPNPKAANVSGDYLVSNGIAESQLANSVGTRVEVVGYIRDVAIPHAANGQKLPRRMAVSEWHPAGACSPLP